MLVTGVVVVLVLGWLFAQWIHAYMSRPKWPCEAERMRW